MKGRSTVKLYHLMVVVIIAIFVVTGVATILIVQHHERRDALEDAETIANLLLDRNLAIHTYFARQLKPSVFTLSDRHRSAEYFDPAWMSSSYAVREIVAASRQISHNNYYYKECAINARNSANEADAYEQEYLRRLNNGTAPERVSAIRTIDGVPQFVVMRKGEVIDESCLTCHDDPAAAPRGLVARYGSVRGFHRRVGEVISAVSVRIPLSDEFSAAHQLTVQLSGFLLTVLAVSFTGITWLFRRFIFTPLETYRDRALQIAAQHENLTDPLPRFYGVEFHNLSEAFGVMSARLNHTIESLQGRFVLFMEHLPGIAVMKDRAGRYLFVNDQWQRLSGCTERDDWCLKSNDDIWPPPVAARMNTREEGIHAGDGPSQSVEHYSLDGRDESWLVSRFPVTDRDGSFVYLGAIGINVSDRIRAEEELRRSEELYRSLFDNMLNGFAYCRMLFEDGVPVDYIHLAVNPAFKRHTGLTDMIGRRITEVIPGIRETDPQLFEVYGRVARTGTPERFELYVATLRMWFDISVYCPAPEHFVVIFDMISDRKQAEEELRIKQAQLDDAVMEVSIAEERERRRIAGDLHDQVGQNLILGRIRLSMLAGETEDEGTGTALDEIITIIGQAIQDIRTLTFQLSPPLLKDIGLAASLEWLVNKMATDYGLTVALVRDHEPLPLAGEQASAVYRAVRELLINVAKHAGTSEATVRIVRTGAAVTIRVEDRGRGFDRSLAERKLPRDGGFGLIHMRRRIEHVGGSMALESSPGHGTTVTITMPLGGQEENR